MRTPSRRPLQETWRGFRASGTATDNVTAICVSLTEANTEATLARMAELGPVADLFEVRADFVRVSRRPLLRHL